MKAMVLTNFGEPEVITEREVNKPVPRENEVLVKVCATSVNPADLAVRKGFFGTRTKLPAILGYDVSGVIEAFGEGVKDFQVGDEVYYAIDLMNGDGANAEYHVANEFTVAKKPTNISHTEAASVPIAGGTAWAALINRADMKAGETVLIHGGAGGVGSFAIQIAKAAGAIVDYIVGKDLTDIVLLGHSFGSTVIAKVVEEISDSEALPAKRDRIRRLIFFSAFVLNDGESLNDNVPPHSQALFDNLARKSDDQTITMPFEIWREAFLNDADLELAQSSYAHLSPEPYHPWIDKLDLRQFYSLSIPKSYLYCTEDNSLPQGEWGWHPRMSNRLGQFRLVQMPGGHEVMFSNPVGLAEKIIVAGRD